ncbi:MAG TPA: hypothetical protein VMT66_16135 [Steroidobacteraceae bacterium]|nr:hypothetical protein [Steroidobacteraceae bacterium]
MKKRLMSAIGMSIAGLNVGAAFAEGALDSCSLATLRGTYAYGGTGTNATDTYRHSTSGMESYDGRGHLTWYQIWTDSSGTYTYTGTGSYQFTTLTDTSSGVAVTATCVAKVTYMGYGTWTYFVPPDGSAYFFSGTSASPISGGKIERVSLATLVK